MDQYRWDIERLKYDCFVKDKDFYFVDKKHKLTNSNYCIFLNIVLFLECLQDCKLTSEKLEIMRNIQMNLRLLPQDSKERKLIERKLIPQGN